MPYRLKRDETLTESVQRIAREQCDDALASVDGDSLDEAVHEVRKRCKKIRGLVRLVRPGFDDYKEANSRFRDIARVLSAGRDREAALETHRALLERHRDGVDGDQLDAVRQGLEARKREGDDAKDLPARLERATAELRVARQTIDDWSIQDDDDVVAAGIEKTYGRAREALDEVLDHRTTGKLHEWRKRVKYHRYHMKIIRSVWEPIIMARRDQAEALSSLLGDDHDLAMLRPVLLRDPERYGGDDVLRTYITLLDGRRLQLQEDAVALGRRLCSERPKRLGQRLRRLLEIWRRY